ncbi:mannose-1-phosphate guanylyltransferase/mannose-6-phosphate isomerase [Pseudohongiella sp.]|uniref:mannose-1-phosphate guanylyltransferase n=1 Tax=marine sediment metagenome TaxID=412755 RepID=A0A0F9YIX4_9ZZZZ|nr:mannose-1-phosphate guanylyltransferase/mannose-6-phosphate isomerase [Pseudohongiella sp.]HDZ09388.1 mannose-1-phosphate guanylyltransferase/mannose-6-phosphate isomerase [Pseudohongiella sp.]HEA63763.1 mannose-1-phosphate guanylyltransferase/mannose-6-phosphate isomerase [Pseudohongiella sp.]
MIIPVILAGGVGSRLWPLSRQLNPKQFISFAESSAGIDSPTLFQATLSRLAGIDGLAAPIVICNEEHRFLVAEQLRVLDIRNASILLEPEGRNTAPAVTLASILAARHIAQQAAPDAAEPVLLVLPADHIIGDPAIFRRCVTAGVRQALAGRLVTFGIEATYPETGYGYVKRDTSGPQQAGENLSPAGAAEAFAVARFVEKPDAKTAAGYLADGSYYWNSGMFMFTATRWLQELSRLQPDMVSVCQAACRQPQQDGDFVRVAADIFATCPSDSIDYAVMEKTADAVVIPMAAAWSDMGAWSALWDVSEHRTDNNNVVIGDVHCVDVRDSYIRAGSRLVAAVGIENAVIVETADAVLVANKDQVQNVKQVVQWLEQQNRTEAVSHTLVYRPWGSYESLAHGPGFQVKHIRVRPGAALSLQMHHHRAEHWVVISGEATVTCDERIFTLTANQSTFLPLGCKHRLQNKSDEWIELIEVQTGDYLGEDDIVRFEDVYGRVPATK